MEEPLLDIQSTPRKRRVTTWILVLIIIGLTVGLIVVAVQKHNSNGGADNYQYSLDANTTQRILSFLDQSADPCQDFYQYACGNFHHAAPAGGQYAYSFNSIGEMVQAEQLQILTANFPMISDFFNGCMDVDTIESRNITDLRKWLSQIDAATSPVDIINIVGSLQHMSMATSALFLAQIQSDYHYADKYHLYVMPGGTTFSDPDQYQTSDLRGQMFAYFVQLFSYDMDPYPATKLALQAAKDVWALEYTIANFSHYYDGSDADRAYVISRTRMMANSTIFSEITGMNWNSYFTSLQASPHPASDVIAVVDGSRGNCPSPVNPCPDSFFFKLGQLLQITPMPILKNYLKWHLFLGVSRYLPKYFRDIGDELVDDYGVQAFHANIRGNLKASSTKHRQQFCQAETVTQFANYLSHEWIVSDLPQGTIPAVGQLVDLIYQQIGNRLNTVEWLQNDNVTRTAAHHKWEEIAKNVGPTSGWYSYSHLYMTGNPLIDRATIQKYYLQQTSKLYETYVNRSQTTPNQDWTIQNAYYDPTTNSINLIPGLMFPPFYSPKVPQFLNLATYGMVIGHEITHGFDNSGRLYNGTGAFVNWWTNQTAQEFDRRATCLVNQYSGYKVVNQTYINGKQTLGENIADNGGIRAAWNAYKYTTANNQPGPAMAQFNNDQLFFVYYAQSWCVNATAAGLERQVKNDVHSPAKWRVNGPLSNLPYFAQSYGCRADQPMGRSLDDSKRCEVW